MNFISLGIKGYNLEPVDLDFLVSVQLNIKNNPNQPSSAAYGNDRLN